MIKKEFFLTFAILFVLFVSLVGVNAGWWNGITGSATKPATAKVNITGAASDPVIWYVSDLNSTFLVNYNQGGITYHSFSFLACSSAGVTILPDAGNVATRVTPYTGFIGSYGWPIQSLVNATNCSFIGTVSAVPTSGCGSTTQSRNYSCVVKMYYYYDPVTWRINASLKDDTNRLGVNSSKTFILSTNKGWTTNLDPSPYVNWTGVLLGGSSDISDNNITFILQGNYDIGIPANILNINATPLNGTTITYQQILGNNFKSGGVDPCAGTSLLNNQYQPIPSFVINHSYSTNTFPINGNLTFCLGTLSGINAQTYETSITAKWMFYTPGD